MNLPRSVADVLTDHVVFEVECIDRMYCNAYMPGLQYAAGLVSYVHQQLGLPIASTAPLAKISERFTAAVHRFALDHRVPWVNFVKGQRKDDVMHEHLATFTAPEGVVFIGRAQEKTPLFRTEKRLNGEGRSYPWIAGVHRDGQPLLLLVRHEAPGRIPSSAGRNSKGGFWVRWLTPIRKVTGTRACQESGGRVQLSEVTRRGTRVIGRKLDCLTSQSPDDAKNHPPERHLKPVPRSVSAL
jgi:hypothetical protein